MYLDKNTKILIVGLGLIGGSYAQKLTSLGFEVGAISLEEDDINFALENHYISSGSTKLEKEYVSKFDLVIFALYPHVFLSWIKEYQHLLKHNALITDVTGIKEAIIYDIQNILREDISFVAAHPMAGREVSGVRNSNPDIFINANYIVVPTNKNKEEDILKIEELGKLLGFKNIARLSPSEHDEMIGFLSQLTHCIAISLMTCKNSTHLSEYTGDSFRDLTRIGKINEEMWCELFLLNKKKLLKEMELFINQFNNLKDAIENEQEDKIKEIMKLSTKNRSYFDKR